MRAARHILVMLVALASVVRLTAMAEAAGPRNPYSSFNLSGINYGAQQWDRDQRAGRVVWPYYNVPSRNNSRNSSRGSGLAVGGVITGGAGAGTIIQGGTSRPSSRAYSTRGSRRWRR